MSDVLSRIRLAAAEAAASPLADARERPVFPRVAAASPFPPEAGPAEYLDRFRLELETLTGRVYGPFDADGVAAGLADLILEKARTFGAWTEGRGDRTVATHFSPRELSGSDSPEVAEALSVGDEGRLLEPELFLDVISWSEEEIGVPGLAARLRESGIRLVPAFVPNDTGHQQTLEEYSILPVGLTGALAGLADTGSIVVASGPGRARVASLLPLVHVAVLDVGRIFPTMQDWLAAEGAEMARDTANLVVVTGSSRTSDIELQLTLGMHGPKEIHVVLYRGRG